MRARVEKSSQAPRSGRVTRAIMVESGKQLAGWSRQLRRLGAPRGDELRPGRQEDGTNLLYEADDSGKQIAADYG